MQMLNLVNMRNMGAYNSSLRAFLKLLLNALPANLTLVRASSVTGPDNLGVLQTVGNNAPMFESAGINIDCYGDSLSILYPAIFMARLNGLMHKITSYGVGGETSIQILVRITAAPVTNNYAVILMGANNILATEQVKSDIAAAYAKLSNNGNKVLVLTCIGNVANPIGSASLISQNAINTWILATYPNNSVDIYTYLRSQYNPGIPQDVTDLANGVTPGSLRVDGIHLNTIGYNFVVDKVQEFFQSDLSLIFPAGALNEPTTINILLQSVDLTQAVWINTGTITTTRDDAGARGIPNTACTITDTDAAVLSSRRSAVAIPANTDKICFSVYIKKDTNETRIPLLFCELTGGTAQYGRRVDLNTKTGGFTSALFVDCGVINCGAFWRVWGTIINNGTNTFAKLYVYPANAFLLSGNDPSCTGSIVVDLPQIEVGNYPSSPVPTTSAAVTRAGSTFSSSGIPSTGAWIYEFIYIAKCNSAQIVGSMAWFCNYTDANNYVCARINSVICYVDKCVAGVHEYVTMPWTQVAGLKYKLLLRRNADGTFALAMAGMMSATGLGAELLVDTGFDVPGSWTTNDASITVSGSAATFTATPTGKAIYQLLSAGLINKVISCMSSNALASTRYNQFGGSTVPTSTTPQAALATTNYFGIVTQTGPVTGTVTSTSAKEVYNSTTATQPVLVSAYNIGADGLGANQLFGSLIAGNHKAGVFSDAFCLAATA